MEAWFTIVLAVLAVGAGFMSAKHVHYGAAKALFAIALMIFLTGVVREGAMNVTVSLPIRYASVGVIGAIASIVAMNLWIYVNHAQTMDNAGRSLSTSAGNSLTQLPSEQRHEAAMEEVDSYRPKPVVRAADHPDAVSSAPERAAPTSIPTAARDNYVNNGVNNGFMGPVTIGDPPVVLTNEQMAWTENEVRKYLQPESSVVVNGKGKSGWVADQLVSFLLQRGITNVSRGRMMVSQSGFPQNGPVTVGTMGFPVSMGSQPTRILVSVDVEG